MKKFPPQEKLAAWLFTKYLTGKKLQLIGRLKPVIYLLDIVLLIHKNIKIS